jgi:D-alanyl-D-alanine carboxypeptidase/D-alanyl-D-alanine-endopeptidase (penicillin-binding protein 4)
MVHFALGLFLSYAAFFQQSLDSLIASVDNEKALELSVLVKKLDGEVLFQHQAQRPLVLASNTKLFTTAAALLEMGADYKWHTTAYLHGNDLAIVGGGDPSMTMLDDSDLAQQFIIELLQKLRAAQISKLDNLYIDGSSFTEQRHKLWPLEHQWDYFCAPPTSLSVNGGCISIDFDGSAASFYPNVSKSLSVAHYGKPSESLSAWWADNGETLWLRTPPGKQQTAVYAVPDGLQFFSWWIRDEFKAAGLDVGQVIIAPKPNWENSSLLLDYSSALSLQEVVYQINKESNNFMAEVVLKSLAVMRGVEGSYLKGVASVNAVLAEHDFELTDFEQLDGSGMARSNTINNSASPETICEVLERMAFEPAGEVWFSSLAVGGVDGTLKNRFTDQSFQPQRVHAKTGFIHSKQSVDGFGASSLSGYLLLPDNEIAVFAFVVNFKRKINKNTNNRRFKSLQQQFLKQLLDEYRNE